jgi:neuropeptide Y receptor
MVGSLQAVSIFVSTLSITVIALDRYQLIVYPTKRAF